MPAATEATVQHPHWQTTAWELIKTIAIALGIALVIRTFLFQPFNIPSGSMEDTLLVGDYLFVSKYTYGYSRHSFPYSLAPFEGRVLGGAPKRGDVVVFRLPSNTNVDYIKRVIGLPGDRIQMRDGLLYLNGEAAKVERIGEYVKRGAQGQVIQRVAKYRETLPDGFTHYILDISSHSPTDNTREFVVPPDHYFMMGDNRDDSTDSRVPPEREGVGFVPAENLVGRAEIIFFSTNGNARLWEIWKWPWAIRYDRLFSLVE